MAASDNVIRSGLTPKLKDIPTLTEMLTYDSKSAVDQLLKPLNHGNHSLLFDPPIEEFSVIQTVLKMDETETLQLPGPSIVIFIQGRGMLNEASIEQGQVYFVYANTSFELKNNSEEPLICYTAFCQ
jgi:mannose-6-phosphate isomerase